MAEEETKEQTVQTGQQEPEGLTAEEQMLLEQEQARLAEEAAAAAKEEQRNQRISAILSLLICLCLIVEVVLGSYIGLTLYRNHQNQQVLAAKYEVYLEQLNAQRTDPPKVQYIGPTVRVVDGVLVENYPKAQLPA